MRLFAYISAYGATRAVAALAALSALAIYTRVLTPAEYGKLAVATAVLSIGYSALYSHLATGILRYLQSSASSRPSFLRTIITAFLGISAVLVISAMIAAAAGLRSFSVGWVAATVALLIAHSWFEIGQGICHVDLQPLRYSVGYILRAVLTLSAGAAAAVAGCGAVGVIVAMAGSALLVSAIHVQGWLPARGGAAELSVYIRTAAYGVPLALASLLSSMAVTVDRFMLGLFDGAAAVGTYAAAADLSVQSIYMLCMAVSLATYPLCTQAYREEGRAGARKVLFRGGCWLMAIGVGAASGLAMLAEQVSNAIMGIQFSATAKPIIQLSALAALINALRSYHVDLSFQMSERTSTQAVSAVVWLCTTLAFTAALIPKFGGVGAACGNVLGATFGLAASLWLTRNDGIASLGQLPWFRSGFAAVIMCTCLSKIALKFEGLIGLVSLVLVGALIYVLTWLATLKVIGEPRLT